MSVAPFTRRIPKRFKKTITFAGGSGTGAVGTVAVGTVTGSILFTHLTARCTTLLASSGGGTLELGTANNTAGLIPLTTATDIDADEFWQDTTPEVKISPAILNQAVCANIIATVATGDITAGVIEIIGYWLPLSDDGNLA
ncbi:MAG: hypothetical protein ACREA9_25645 [Pyrinomonadaceae bacterium]